MAQDFKKYAEDAQRFVENLARDLGIPDDHQKARRILKAVLHTIRDRIMLAESFQLMAQLPTILKGIYVEDWKYSEKPLKFRSKQTMLQELIRSEHLAQPDDFPHEDFAVFAVNMVFKNLSHYVSQGELEDVIGQLPSEIRETITLQTGSN